MRPLLVGLRALGEAILWGTAGAALYGLLLGIVFNGRDGEVDGWFSLALICGSIGLSIGVLTGMVGAVVAVVLALAGAGDRLARVVAGVTSALCVGVPLWVFMDEDGGVVDFIVEARDWWLFVIGPAGLALAIGAWRAPIVLRTGSQRAVSAPAPSTEG